MTNTKTIEQAHLLFSVRLREVANSTLRRRKGCLNLGGIIKNRKTRTPSIGNYALKFQKKGEDGFCNI